MQLQERVIDRRQQHFRPRFALAIGPRNRDAHVDPLPGQVVLLVGRDLHAERIGGGGDSELGPAEAQGGLIGIVQHRRPPFTAATAGHQHRDVYVRGIRGANRNFDLPRSRIQRRYPRLGYPFAFGRDQYSRAVVGYLQLHSCRIAGTIANPVGLEIDLGGWRPIGIERCRRPRRAKVRNERHLSRVAGRVLGARREHDRAGALRRNGTKQQSAAVGPAGARFAEGYVVYTGLVTLRAIRADDQLGAVGTQRHCQAHSRIRQDVAFDIQGYRLQLDRQRGPGVSLFHTQNDCGRPQAGHRGNGLYFAVRVGEFHVGCQLGGRIESWQAFHYRVCLPLSIESALQRIDDLLRFRPIPWPRPSEREILETFELHEARRHDAAQAHGLLRCSTRKIDEPHPVGHLAGIDILERFGTQLRPHRRQPELLYVKLARDAGTPLGKARLDHVGPKLGIIRNLPCRYAGTDAIPRDWYELTFFRPQ